jgi:hypothetical protein
MTDLVIKTLLVVGSTAVTEYVERGTQRRAVRTGFGVIEASNKSFTVHGLAITEFDGDLIRSHRVYSDGAFQMLAHSPTSSWTTRKHP